MAVSMADTTVRRSATRPCRFGHTDSAVSLEGMRLLRSPSVDCRTQPPPITLAVSNWLLHRGVMAAGLPMSSTSPWERPPRGWTWT